MAWADAIMPRRRKEEGCDGGGGGAAPAPTDVADENLILVAIQVPRPALLARVVRAVLVAAAVANFIVRDCAVGPGTRGKQPGVRIKLSEDDNSTVAAVVADFRTTQMASADVRRKSPGQGSIEAVLGRWDLNM